MKQLSGETMLLTTRLSTWKWLNSQRDITYYKNPSTRNKKSELAAKGEILQKASQGVNCRFAILADVTKEIYDHRSLVQAARPHYSPIYTWISDTFHDNLDDLVKGITISRRNIGKNYMGQKLIFSLQSLIVRQLGSRTFSVR